MKLAPCSRLLTPCKKRSAFGKKPKLQLIAKSQSRHCWLWHRYNKIQTLVGPCTNWPRAIPLPGHPWLCARDLRTVLGHLPTDGVLLRLFGENAELRTRSKTLWLKVEALEPYLARSTSKNSIDFKNWLQKTVLLPSRRRRGEPIAQIAQDVGATSDRG